MNIIEALWLRCCLVYCLSNIHFIESIAYWKIEDNVLSIVDNSFK